MNAPEHRTLGLQVPQQLLMKQPPARFSMSDDVKLTITVGNEQVTLSADDLRRLDAFVGRFGGSE